MAGLQSFKSSFKNDLARPNRFEVLITFNPYFAVAERTIREMVAKKGISLSIPAEGEGEPVNNASQQLRYRCEVAQLPGRTFETVEQKTYGPIEKYPNLTTYTDIDLTFILDDDMSNKAYFDGWLNLVNSTATNNFLYKSFYTTDIQIYQYTVTNQKSYGVNLIDAYPISMNQLDLDWSSDGYHKLTVTFAYTYWEPI